MTFEIRTDYDELHLEELQKVLDRALDRGIHQMAKRQHYMLGGAMIAGGLAIGSLGGLRIAFGVLACCAGVYLIDHGRRYFMYMSRKIRKKLDPAFTGNDYIVDDMGIQVINALSNTEYQYADCTRFIETEDNFYLIMSDNQGMILDKERVEGGSVDQLRDHLKQFCPVELEKMDFFKK